MKIAKYFVVGGVSAVIDIAIFSLLTYLLSVHYLAAGASGFVIATLVNYALGVRFVFTSGVRFGRRTEVAAVFAVSLVGLLVHQTVLWAGVEMVGLHSFISKLCASASAFFWNYGARSRLVFPEPKKAATSDCGRH